MSIVACPCCGAQLRLGTAGAPAPSWRDIPPAAGGFDEFGGEAP